MFLRFFYENRMIPMKFLRSKQTLTEVMQPIAASGSLWRDWPGTTCHGAATPKMCGTQTAHQIFISWLVTLPATADLI
jgi:hypothetical protein